MMPRWLGAGGLLLMLAPSPVSGAAPGAFSFSISHSRASWQYPARLEATTITRAELHLTEALTRRVTGTLRLMYLDLSQADNPLPEARNASGKGAGVSVRVGVLNSEMLNLNWRLAYAYQTVSSPPGAQAAEFVWHSWRSGLDVTLFPTRIVSVLGGAELGRIDGEQRMSGALNQVLPFTESQHDSYYAGLRLRTDYSGSIELKAYTGARETLQLVFRRRF
jgi:hypothetical protein